MASGMSNTEKSCRAFWADKPVEKVFNTENTEHVKHRILYLRSCIQMDGHINRQFGRETETRSKTKYWRKGWIQMK